MKVLVFLELGADVRIPPERDPRSGRVREEWLVREIDPASARALDLALRSQGGAARHGGDRRPLSGPPDAEPWLRQALARGLRPGGARLGRGGRRGPRRGQGGHPGRGRARRPASTSLLAGAAGVIDASGQLGVLLAAHLGVPCVTQVVGIAPQHEAGGPACGASLEITRGLDRGFRERVEAVLPVVADRGRRTRPTPEAAPPADDLRGRAAGRPGARDPRVGPGRPGSAARPGPAGRPAPALRPAPTAPSAAPSSRGARLVPAGVRPHPQARAGIGAAPRGPRRPAARGGDRRGDLPRPSGTRAGWTICGRPAAVEARHGAGGR